MLPEPGWPPGREAPGDLERLRRFVNTHVDETGGEAFTDPASLDRWLETEGWNRTNSGTDDLRRLLGFRGALRLVVATPDDPAAWAALAEAAEPARLRLLPTGDLGPADSGVDGLISSMIAVLSSARPAGTWERLKACHNCRWLYYDRSRSGTGAWCWMGACGSRIKQRAYRSRHASPPRSTASDRTP